MIDKPAIPAKFARQYQRFVRWRRLAFGWAVAMMALTIALFLTSYHWFALLPAVAIVPSAWVFDLYCYRCHWPVLAIFGTAPDWIAKDQFFAPDYAKETSTAPACCSKCHAPFVAR